MAYNAGARGAFSTGIAVHSSTGADTLGPPSHLDQPCKGCIRDLPHGTCRQPIPNRLAQIDFPVPCHRTQPRWGLPGRATPSQGKRR
jgi:hypothetical protein